MKSIKKKTSQLISLVLLLALFISVFPQNAQAAESLDINLKNNQTFYLLPGTEKLNFKVKVTASNITGDQTCSSSNLSVADIDNMGNMVINDAGSTNITVTVGDKKVTRTIKVLRRTDWTRVITVKNKEKLVAKNQVCSIKLTNQMDFPVKTVLHYNTIADSGSTISSDVKTSDIYLPAGKSITYKMMVPDGITMISVTGADFIYDQFGLKKIDSKKVVIKESILPGNAKNSKVITEKITNKNKVGIVQPYHLYLYDQKGNLISVEYKFIKVAAKQKTNVSYTYTTKDKYLDSYVAKVKYKFETPLPFF